MDLSRVILGPVATEKAQRLKENRTYTLRVAPAATKIEVKRALEHFYDVDVAQVRALRSPGKDRLVGRGTVMQKRKPAKKVMVTLTESSKKLDITAPKT